MGHGRILCFSVYCGKEADFGGGANRLWVDVLTGGDAVLKVFKPYLECESIKKVRCNFARAVTSRSRCQQVWHNYAFDKHIFENEEISPAGFGGDTMHMARLWDSSRTGKGYSLEALTNDPDVMSDAFDSDGADIRSKLSMKELFGKPNIKKDGSDGKLVRVWVTTSVLSSPALPPLSECAPRHYRAANKRRDAGPLDRLFYTGCAGNLVASGEP